MKNIVILISGNGSNLQAIINACKTKKIKNGSVCAVFSNKKDAFGLTYAKNAGIPTHVLQSDYYDPKDREIFDFELMKKINTYSPDVIALAGYMRILSSKFVNFYAGRLLNIHPSLLPKYPGLYTHKQAIVNGDKEHGSSIHFVTPKLDGGPIILQVKIPIFTRDNEYQLIRRIKMLEHIIYPLVIKWFVNNRLKMHSNAAWLDGMKLPNKRLENFISNYYLLRVIPKISRI